MKISLARFNGRGASAQLENTDMDYFSIAEGNTYSARKACQLAAERLRSAAMRFEALANMEHPFNEGVQDIVNKSL